jgi:hypothetical protein
MIKRYFLVVILLINFTKSNAQKEEIIAGTIGAGIAIFAAAAAYDAFIEKLENEATEWVLMNRPECNRFRLKLMNLRGEKLTNMSDISSCTFLVEPSNSEKFVMMWIVNEGWWNDYGVVFDKIVIRTFNREDWKELLWGFFKCGTDYMECTADSIPVYNQYDFPKNAEQNWNIAAKQKPYLAQSSFKKIIQDEEKGVFYSLRDITSLKSLVSVKGNKFDFSNPSNNELPLTIDFEKMDGDTYVVEDVRDLRVVYNERSINIFFKSINALVKFRNSVFADITNELLALH